MGPGHHPVCGDGEPCKPQRKRDEDSEGVETFEAKKTRQGEDARRRSRGPKTCSLSFHSFSSWTRVSGFEQW